MNYEKIHNQLIERACDRASSKKEANLILGYSEAHHIIPKCMGGTNEKSNIVHLSAREHFIVHILLTKIYPNNIKLWFACHRLMHTNHNDKRLNGKKYEKIKTILNEMQRLLTKETSDSVRRTAEKLTGRTKETHPYLVEAGKKMSKARKGKTKENDETVRKTALKISFTLTGQTKENSERVRKTAEKLSGRVRESCQKLSKETKLELIYKRNAGATYKELHQWIINDIGIDISHRAISEIYKREVERNNQLPVI